MLKQKPIAEIDDETIILADISQKAINQLEQSIIELLPESYSLEEKKKISDALTQGHWTHDFPISIEVARGLGLNATTNVLDEVFKLMDLFPQPVRSTPSVETGPGPANYNRGQKK